MTEFHTLIGAEDVKIGGAAVREGGQAISSAAGSLEHTISMAYQRGHELLDRLEAILKEDREQREGGTE